MATDRDDSERIVAAVNAAIEQQRPVTLCGSGTKARRYGALSAESEDAQSERLSTIDHCGILHYAPDELVLEARAGTPLRDIEQALAAHQQMLAFEPPRYRSGGTLGGTVAVGLSGPARPWRGSLRDAVLGVEMINGLGERLQFGGRVVKNVAGYDLSRLQAGAFGTFGCLLSVCVRVMPKPLSEQTLVLALSAEQALQLMASWTTQSLPLAGSCYYDSRLWVRLLGAPDAVAAATACIGGELSAEQSLWQTLRDQSHPFFTADGPLWRLSLPLGAPALPFDDRALIEWGGAQRWYSGEHGLEPERLHALGGRLLSYADTGLSTVDRASAQVGARLREAFDPHGLFNRHLCSHAN
ncbi:MAG: glycolate oxidase subunit GlcE [Pseudomonadales bacterium]